MRLICPNCTAQYEIDARAVPAKGRDVQCSACGHVWFQLGTPVQDDAAPDRIETPAPPAPQRLTDPVTPGYRLSIATSRATRPAASRFEEDPSAPSAAEPPAVTVVRPPVDRDVLAILREEAERETDARRAEGSLIEQTEPETLIEAAPESAEPAPAYRPAPPAQTPPAAPERSGFRTGFWLVIGLAVVVLALYSVTGPLSQSLPGLSPLLDAYASTIDEGRLALNQWLHGAFAWLGIPLGR